MFFVDNLQELLVGLEEENHIKKSIECEIIVKVDDEVFHSRHCERVKDLEVEITTAGKMMDKRACNICIDNIWDWSGIFNKESDSVLVSLHLCRRFISRFLDINVILELANSKKDSFLLLNDTLKRESIINYAVEDLISEAEEIIWLSSATYLSTSNGEDTDTVTKVVDMVKDTLQSITSIKNSYLKNSEDLNLFVNSQLQGTGAVNTAYMVVGPNFVEHEDSIPSSHDNLIRLILAVWCYGAKERMLLELPMGVIQSLRKWGWPFVHSMVYAKEELVSLREAEKLWDKNPENPYFFFDKAYSAIKMLNLNQS